MMEPGIHNLTREEYDAIDAVNSSLLKQADRSLRHAKGYADGHRKDSDSKDWGSAYHKFLLQPEAFASDYAIFDVPPNRKSDWGKEYWAEIEAQVGEKEADRMRKEAQAEYDATEKRVGAAMMLSKKDHAELAAMRTVLHEEREHRRITTAAGRYEVSVIWNDAETGTLCKGMIDKIAPALFAALDLKTTRDARAHSFQKDAANFGYDIQAAMYLDGLEAVTGEKYDFAFLAQETEFPYLPVMYTVENGGDAHEIGRCKYRALLKSVLKSKETGVWTGYENPTRPLCIPEWSVPEEIKSGAWQ